MKNRRDSAGFPAGQADMEHFIPQTVGAAWNFVCDGKVSLYDFSIITEKTTKRGDYYNEKEHCPDRYGICCSVPVRL